MQDSIYTKKQTLKGELLTKNIIYGKFNCLSRPHQDDLGVKQEKKIVINTDKKLLPTNFVSGKRTYYVLPVLQDGEKRISSDETRTRATRSNAHLDLHHYNHVLNHKENIPSEFQGTACFIFTAVKVDHPDRIAVIDWDGSKWINIDQIALSSLWNGIHPVFLLSTKPIVYQ